MIGDESLCLRPATELAQMVRDRQVASRELVTMHLERIERINPAINAVVTLDAEEALSAAAVADELSARGESLGPLHGLPVTIKDAIEVAGMRSTGGSRALADHVPASDAPAVARLRRAGAVILGKTNVPEWSADIQTFNSLFGTTSNPWDLSHTPGGSSGGAAAAVATGLTTVEVGTDIGGSVRIPSSFCGICGHKPSYGIISQRGYLNRVGGSVINTDINVFGPMARSVADLDLILGVLAGPDADDAVAWRVELPPPRHSSLADYRIGLWLDDPHCEVESSALELMQDAAGALIKAGAQVSDARPPLDFGRVDKLFNDLVLAAISASVDDEVGQAVGGSHRDWLELNGDRVRLRQIWAEWFREFDVILCPVVPMLPFRHNQTIDAAERSVVINGRARPQAGTLAWTGLVGVAYLPATVVPIGRVGDLPVGIQVVGPHLEDRTALFAAHRLAELTGGYQAPPIARPGPDSDDRGQ